MIAMTVATVILCATLAFINFSSVSMSGITAQANVNEQAATALQMMQSRARTATSVSNDATGSILTLGFDDNYNVDSNGDGLAYNDTDHIEQFKIVGTSTNVLNSTNSLIYISTNGYQQVLIPTGLVKLPGRNVFTVTNAATTLIRFAVVDGYAPDRYQAIDIHSTAVILNRTVATNVIAIIY
jgi:type II secretory pathway pseudopilin PulG